MSLLATIKSDLLVARKAKNKTVANILTPVLGDAQTAFLSKPRDFTFDDTPDEVILAVINSHIKNAELTLSKVPDAVEARETMAVLGAYKPKQLSFDELEVIISEFINSPEYTGKGSLMKFMSSNYKDQYNGKVVAEIHDEMV